MNWSMIELRMSRETALWLGCIEPIDIEDHRAMRASGQFLLVRDRLTQLPMFWWIVPLDQAIYRSS